MNDVETPLAAMLAERAERISPVRGHREQTLRRARRRRLVNGTCVGAAAVLVVAGGFGAVRALDTPADPVRPAAPETTGETTATAGRYGFWSTTAPAYPYVATGYFRAAEWELRAAATSLAPDSELRLTFLVDAGRSSASGSVTLPPTLDPLSVQHLFGDWAPRADVAALFGTAPPETETVEVSLRNGATFEAHVFGGYENKTAHALDYFVVFLPEDVPGEVVARDAGGDVAASAVIPRR